MVGYLTTDSAAICESDKNLLVWATDGLSIKGITDV